MHIKIDVQALDSGWAVRVLDPKTSVQLIDGPPRLIRVSESGDFPLPPLSEPAPGEPQITETVLRDRYSKIVGGTGGSESVVFGSYLFRTLIGAELWRQIDKLAGAQPIELLLSLPATETALNRLPWEMMHGPKLFQGEKEESALSGKAEAFLAEDAQISITRVVANEGQPKEIILISPPRVLIVVGTTLDSAGIRPGAEYLGLLRKLNTEELSLKTQLLIEANRGRVEAAVKEFRPTVVHFICHGNVNQNGKGYLELTKDENPRPDQLYAANLLQILLTSDNIPLPQVVVLNACYTASAQFWKTGQVAYPLSIELIRGGIPIVVGMAGRVADQACRLFTQGFYQAMLTNGDLGFAAAQGRRTGIRYGTNPRDSVDWAFPALFIAEGIKTPCLQLSDSKAEMKWQKVAQQYAPDYPPCCDRLELFKYLTALLAEPATQKALAQRDNEFQVLAAVVKQSDSVQLTRPRLGRTWLLRALAAEATRAGHLPCLLTDSLNFGAKGPWPRDLPSLLSLVRSSLYVTAKNFELSPASWRCLDGLEGMAQGQPLALGLPTDLSSALSAFGGNPRDSRVLAVAFRLDVLDFLNSNSEEGTKLLPEGTKLLLLFDDVHRMDAAAGELCGALLGTYGLRAPEARKKVRTVLTYSSLAAEGQSTAIKGIEDNLNRTFAEIVTLERFKPPIQERLAYEHFLLQWRDDKDKNRERPVCVDSSIDEKVAERFFERFAREVEGIPSNMLLNASGIIRLSLDLNVLRDADDVARLKSVCDLKRQ